MKEHIQPINIVLYILLTVFTFGFFYFIWQYKQIKQINILAGDVKDSFFKWFFLSLITFGIYHVYHEYKMSEHILELQDKYETKKSSKEFPLLCLLISLFGFFIIIDFVHQEEINKLIKAYNSSPTLY